MTKFLFATFLFLSSFYSFSQVDYSITDVKAITAGNGEYPAFSAIQQGAPLDSITFIIRNNSNTTVSAGTVINVDLRVANGNVTPLGGSLSNPLGPFASTKFYINCTSSGLAENFPSTLGSFSICVEATMSGDPNSSNDSYCTTYNMVQAQTQSYDFAVQNLKIVDPVGLSYGDDINLGTSLDSIAFDLVNAGNTTILAGTSWSAELTIDNAQKDTLYFQIPMSLTPGARINGIITDCRSSRFDKDFPTTPGSFAIRVSSLYSPDPGTPNNTTVAPYVMKAVPTITSISPSAGPVGTTVTINGNYFPTTINAVRFSFGINANIISKTSTQIVVQVPAGAQTGSIQVDFGSSIEFTPVFTIQSAPAHTITSISPTIGPIGSTVTINGTNFSSVPSNNTVFFAGNVSASVVTASANQLTVSVPSGAQNGAIEVIVNSIAVQSAQSFTVSSASNPVQITDFNPKKGVAGMQITIDGLNFSDTAAQNIVKFGGGAIANVISATSTQLIVEAPANGIDGLISVELAGLTAYTSQAFDYSLDPLIVDFNPKSGPRGTSVTITGANFDPIATNNEIFFGAISAGTPVASQDGKRLITAVPQSVGFGSAPVSVRVNGVTLIADDEFNVDVTSIEEAGNSMDLKLSYFDGQLMINSGSSNDTRNLEMSVYSIEGKLVASRSIAEKAMPWTRTFDIALKPGVYLVNLSNDNGFRTSQKISVH